MRHLAFIFKCGLILALNFPSAHVHAQDKKGDAPGSSRASWRLINLSGTLQVSPGEGRLSASMTMDIVPAGRKSPNIDFFLNRGLDIKELLVDGEPVSLVLESDMDRIPRAPMARRVALPAPEISPLIPSRRIELKLRFEGKLESLPGKAPPISWALTDLNFHSGWFPLFEGDHAFPYELNLSVPAGFHVISAGHEEPGLREKEDHEGDGDMAGQPGGPGKWWLATITGRSSVGDLPLVISPTLSAVPVEPSEDCNLRLFTVPLPEGMPGRIGEEATWACAFLADRTGWSPQGADSANPSFSSSSPALIPGKPDLTIVVVPRDEPGYARPPLVVAPAGWFVEAGGPPSTDDEEAGWRRRLFHEIAHVFAPLAETSSFHGWLNEGLAEFLALEALAERRGGEAAARYYRRYLLELAERMPGPPVPMKVYIGARTAADPEKGSAGPASATSEEGGASSGRPVQSGHLRSIGATRPRALIDADVVRRGHVLLSAIAATRRTDPDAKILYYRKGALIIRMLEGLAGEEIFRQSLSNLRRNFSHGLLARMNTGAFIGQLEERSGRDFGWVVSDWIYGTGLPRFAADLDWTRIFQDEGSDGEAWTVAGELTQGEGRKFDLRIPLLAARGPVELTLLARLPGRRASVDWKIPFEPDAVFLDQERLIPRIDTAVLSALKLRERAARTQLLTEQGLAAHKRRDFGMALERYEAASAADPDAAYPHYRMGRALANLDHPKRATRAYKESIRLGEKEFQRAGRARRKCALMPAMACDEPGLWAGLPPDLRSWNWVRIGQLHDLNGKRRKAIKAYAKALDLPDVLRSHETANRCVEQVCVETMPLKSLALATQQ